MTVIDDAIIDDDILRGDTAVATGLVLAGLHTDGIIADIEGAMRDDDVLAGFDIHAISVLAVPGVTDIEVIEHEVLAAHRVEVPCGAVLKRDPFQQDILAPDEMEHHRPQERFDNLPQAVVGDDGHILVEAV